MNAQREAKAACRRLWTEIGTVQHRWHLRDCRERLECMRRSHQIDEEAYRKLDERLKGVRIQKE